MKQKIKTAKWHGVDGVVVSQLRDGVEEALGLERLNETFDEIARHVRLSVGAHQSAVSYIPDGDFSRAIHGMSLSEKYAKYSSYDVLPTGEGIWAVIFEQGKPMRLTEAELLDHPRFLNFSTLKDDRGLEHPPLPGWLAVPVLKRTGEAIGVLQLSDRFEGDFTIADQNTLENAAALIAPTMEAEYFNEQSTSRAQELQRTNKELRQAQEELEAERREAVNLATAAEEARAGLAEANDALEQSNDALERSNVDLQQFAYVASHDLQSPLRAIAGFAQFLKDDYQGQLDKRADDYIDRITSGCERMQTMINDLLVFSRVESRARPYTATNLNEVFEDVLNILASSIQDSGADVRSGELPVVKCDPAQLSHVFLNLIGNSLKYQSLEPPQVRVSAEINCDGEWTISVSDNGIGIEAKHHKRIFDVFRRLHTEDEFPGNGIGLSICRRIIDRHRGKIWVDSEENKGSTFRFTLPRRLEEE